jgi:predicted metal-dependent phosphoesterase TrpH
VIKFDIHIHTRRYSPCSDIDPFELLPRAAEIGLSGIVIVEHNALWGEEDINTLKREQEIENVTVFAGTEIRSRHGDLLVFGVSDLRGIRPGGSARDILEAAHDRGGAVVIAHPTRYGLGCDRILFDLEFDGMEVMSTNMCADEQDQALALSSCTGIKAVGASDAHTLHSVGDYYTVFDDPVEDMDDFVSALREGRFRTVLEPGFGGETTNGGLRDGSA